MTDNGRLRVWSLIVTVFGDAVAPRGGAIAVATLTDIMTGLGIDGGAVRTALSRLDRDGLIERERVGRNSIARLTPSALADVERASVRIYAAHGPDWADAALAVAAPGRTWETPPDGHRLLAPNVSIGPAAAIDSTGATFVRAALDAATLRQLAARHFADPAESAAFAAFEAQHRALADASATPDAFETVLLRTLLIHHWRRLVLRHAPLPDIALPEDHPVRRARAFAAGLYRRLAPPSDAWLDARIGAARPMPRFVAQDQNRVMFTI